MNEVVVTRHANGPEPDAPSPWRPEPHEAKSIRIDGRELALMGSPSPLGIVLYVDGETGAVEALYLARLVWVRGHYVAFAPHAAIALTGADSALIWVEAKNTNGFIGPGDWAVVGPVRQSYDLQGAGAWRW